MEENAVQRVIQLGTSQRLLVDLAALEKLATRLEKDKPFGRAWGASAGIFFLAIVRNNYS